MSLPNDPMILLSYVNTLLRDTYPSLSELCAAMDADEGELREKLGSVGFSYNEELNAFK